MNFVADINNPQKEEIQNLLDYIKELISEKKIENCTPKEKH